MRRPDDHGEAAGTTAANAAGGADVGVRRGTAPLTAGAAPRFLRPGPF
jgi:hypothetical protein